MQSCVPDRVRVTKRRCAAIVGVACCVLLAAVPLPNSVVPGMRPVPYGFYIPLENFVELSRHHSVMIRTDRPMAMREVWRMHDSSATRTLCEFNRPFGIELPDDPNALLGQGTDLWLPPAELTPSSCCITLYSLRDGVVPARPSDLSMVGALPPMFSHATFDSGSDSVCIYPIPIGLQPQWWRVMHDSKSWPPWGSLGRAALEAHPQLARFAERSFIDDRLFSFLQWVGDTSKVARIQVGLPIAEVDGELRFAETPKVGWFDAYGKEASRNNEPIHSPWFLVLLSVSGGAVLGYLLFAARHRLAGPAA